MKRLKNLWDKMHPEYHFLSDKNLRNQASRVHINNVAMDTEYHETSTSITRNDNRFTVTGNANSYRNNEPNILFPKRLLLRTFQMKISTLSKCN